MSDSEADADAAGAAFIGFAQSSTCTAEDEVQQDSLHGVKTVQSRQDMYSYFSRQEEAASTGRSFGWCVVCRYFFLPELWCRPHVAADDRVRTKRRPDVNADTADNTDAPVRNFIYYYYLFIFI